MPEYNHIDPVEKQFPLPIKQRDLPPESSFANAIQKQVFLPTADGRGVVIALRTDSFHLAKFFEMNWPASSSSEKPDATIIAMKDEASAHGLDSNFDGARWFDPRLNQVWMFGSEFYGNIKITVRGLCSEIAPFEQMFVHGCSMAIDGHGVILSGVSGAGKTTLTASLRKIVGPRLRIVNDDFGPLSLKTGRMRFTGEPYLHMKYPSVRALTPDLEISPASHVSENFQEDANDPHARLLIKPQQVFKGGRQNESQLKMFIVTLRDPEMPAGIRRFTIHDMPLLVSGRYSKFYDKTERFLNGSLFITDQERHNREVKRHELLIEKFPIFLANNVLTPEETALLILKELNKLASFEE